MAGNISGISSYQQVSQSWNNQKKQTEYSSNTAKSNQSAGTDTKTGVSGSLSNVKISEWKPVSGGSSLIPKFTEGYGTTIGDVQLSDKAKEYYDKLKSKFHNMDFILVSKDMKSQVAANASAYGNSAKQVVLIDDEKLERMASDESFRKKYEGIIEMSQAHMQDARNSLVSAGANVKNFGMSVASDGKVSYFATIEKSNEASAKLFEKKQAAKKEAKIKEKKKAEKEAQKERLENIRNKNKAEKADKKDSQIDKTENEENEEKSYLDFKSDSLDDLINTISRYVYDNHSSNVMTEGESFIGSNIDFKG